MVKLLKRKKKTQCKQKELLLKALMPLLTLMRPLWFSMSLEKYKLAAFRKSAST